MKSTVTESATCVLASFFLFIVCLCKGSTSRNTLVQLNDCVCLGHEVTYECTVCGEGATVWTGSLFDCSSGEIILLHRQFTSGLQYEICNNKTVNSTDNTTINGTECFISQLQFVINNDHINKTITCLHDQVVNNTLTQIPVGEISVTVTKEPFPPPSDVHVSNIGPTGVTLSWNALFNCPVFVYLVSSTGDHEGCRNNHLLTHTSSIALPIIPDGKQCNFAVQTQVCGTVNGTKQDPLSVTFKVPKPPVFTCYHSSEHKSIHVAFNELESFNISTGVDGSALFYTVTYSDATSAITCGSTNIFAYSCNYGVCRSQFYLPDSVCSKSVNITATVYATNILGNGSKSQPIYISIDDPEHMSTTGNSFGLQLPLSLSSVSLLLLTLCVIFMSIAVILYRSKTKIQRELEQARNSLKGYTAASFEEIDQRMFTTENVAYSNVQKLW